MPVTVFCLSLLFHCGLSVVVLQSEYETSHPGVALTLECRMGPGVSMSDYTFYWYRQNHYGAPIEFLIKEYYEAVGNFRSSINANKNIFSLQITELHLNDSSTYYCAASHSETHKPDSHTNKAAAHRWHSGRKEPWLLWFLCSKENFSGEEMHMG